MEILRNPDEKVICPYNSSHHIRKTRMEVHLKKCRIAHKESQVLVACDFNACHRVPEPELQYHHSTCPNKNEIELQVITENDELLAPLQPILSIPIDDSWDNCDRSSYNAEQYCMENQILRRLDTESASKRRDFRNCERLRIGNLSSEVGPSKNKTTSNGQNHENLTNLPPVPSDSSPTKEKIPEDISEMLLRNLQNIPKYPVIAKSKK